MGTPNNPACTSKISLGEKQYGSSAALPIFANSIKKIYDLGEFQAADELTLLSDQIDWPISKNIFKEEICVETFEKATRYCPGRVKEIFLNENIPREECQKHDSPFSRFQDK